MDKAILNDVNQYYSEKIKTFGMTSKGVDWNTTESQFLRFDQISKVIKREGQFSICDYGCGFGSYSQYLEENEYDCIYCGIDVSEEMISAAQERYPENARRKYFLGSEITQKYDYIVTSGIFNVKQGVDDEQWKKYVYEVIDTFDKYSSRGFSFNCLTKYSDADYMKKTLYYADPLEMFDFCKKNYSRNVALLHDYELYEFTILVRK